jgi:hypothetical protein
MAERIGGISLFSNQVMNVLGVPPTGQTTDGYGWTETQFQEICVRLSERIAAARIKSIEDDEL